MTLKLCDYFYKNSHFSFIELFDKKFLHITVQDALLLLLCVINFPLGSANIYKSMTAVHSPGGNF